MITKADKNVVRKSVMHAFVRMFSEQLNVRV